MIDYTLRLKESGLKATFQRINMLESIERFGHLSIESIYEKSVKIQTSLSLATVYKNIILMVEKGILVEVPIAGEKSKYELSKNEHTHLICTACAEVEDRPHDENIDKILTLMSQERGFHLTKHQINLYGLCAKCQEAGL